MGLTPPQKPQLCFGLDKAAQRGPETKQFDGASLWCHHLSNIFNYIKKERREKRDSAENTLNHTREQRH